MAPVSARSPLARFLLGGVVLTACSGAGLVIGACLAGLLGPRLFGSLGGHGLGDLGYLLGGGLYGLLVGLALGVWVLLRRELAQRLRIAVAAVIAGALVAGVTALIVNLFGGW